VPERSAYGMRVAAVRVLSLPGEITMRLYLSGPMRNVARMNFPAFAAAAGQLRQAGFEVVSPAEQDEAEGAPPIRSLSDYIRRLPGFLERDFLLIVECDGVATLDNWERSVGARLEVAFARSHGKPIKDYLDWACGGVTRSETLLAEADRLVNGPRGADYGHPSIDFRCAATILRALVQRRYSVDIPFTDDFIGLLMACAIKGSREAGKHKRDTCVDGAGYWQTVEMCHEARHGQTT
jgi:nucleoside 2-deoxyribosyltransferase